MNDEEMVRAVLDTTLRLEAAAKRAVNDPRKSPFQRAFAKGVLEGSDKAIASLLEMLPTPAGPKN